MPGAMTLTLTPRGRAGLNRFEQLGRHVGREALSDGLTKAAIKGATFAFRSFRDRRQYGQGGEAWPDNGGPWARFKEDVLGQRPPVPGQGPTGHLKRSLQFEARSPRVVSFTPAGACTTFGTNLPYALRFTTGGGVQDWAEVIGGKVYRFSQASQGRPFMPTSRTMTAELKKQLDFAVKRRVAKDMGI